MRFVGIVGSRRRYDKEAVFDLVDSLDPKNTTIVTGGCLGPDKWAEERAKELEIPVIIYFPKAVTAKRDYVSIVKEYYARNKLIAEKSDIIYAFVARDRKGGTENTIRFARRRKKQVIIK
jgi:predicted Rossmann fold nucleotide-binding protein DprA/Smf involved in DNA uptake